jgi:glycosyltransferase involved in cell wall biosynthesis
VWTAASIGFYKSAARLLCELRPDLAIVTFDRGAALVPLIVRRKLGKAAPKFVHHVCSVSFAEHPIRYRIGNLLTKLESYAFDSVNTLSPAIATEIYGAGFPRPILIVPIGVDLALFGYRPEARARLRKDLGKDNFLFVFVSTLSANKNVVEIVTAFELAGLEGAARLWVVGDGPLMGELRALLHDRSIRNVDLLGLRDYSSIPDILSAADVAVTHMASKSRSFLQPPIKVLEYLAVGVPVLASDVPGNRFYLDGSGAALFYDPSGLQGMAEGFRLAIEATRGQNASDARSKARAAAQAFSWERIAREALASLTGNSNSIPAEGPPR